MTNSVLYYVISSIATFYLCHGASSNQPLSPHGQPDNVMTSILSVKSREGTTGTSCATKPRTSITSTKRNNIRETFFTRMNEHNTEAFNLLNQLWHSKSGWQHVNTKEGATTHIWLLVRQIYHDISTLVSIRQSITATIHAKLVSILLHYMIYLHNIWCDGMSLQLSTPFTGILL